MGWPSGSRSSRRSTSLPEDRLDEDRVERILVVVAHPDDVDFGASGSVATWVDAGIEVRYCLVTNGDAGGSDLAVSRAEMVTIRQAEQRAAAAVVGVSDLVFLGHPDGRLTPSLDLRRDISRVIRQVRPQRVVTQSPVRSFERIYASHPDHLATGEAALCAVYPDARNPFAHPELLAEGIEAHTVLEVWVMDGGNHTGAGALTTVDITDKLESKLAALRCHASQMSPDFDLDGLIRSWNGATAAAGGLLPGRLAESFRVVDTR